MKPESKRSIAIEDLLRLKRTERPPVEFWAEFDRELRAKQLAALVAKRPWWQRVPVGLSTFARYRLPLGATAVLALTYLAVGEYGSDRLSRGPAAPAHARVAMAELSAIPLVATTVAAVTGMGREDGPAATHVATVIEAPPAPAVRIIERAAFGDRVAWLGVTGGFHAELPALTPPLFESARLVGGGSSDSLRTGSLLKQAGGFESRATAPRGVVEPLQQITPPGERNRARLLTAMVSMTAIDAGARTSERHANRISEEQLYDHINRFGARGAGVSMKF